MVDRGIGGLIPIIIARYLGERERIIALEGAISWLECAEKITRLNAL